MPTTDQNGKSSRDWKRKPGISQGLENVGKIFPNLGNSPLRIWNERNYYG
jgi:hypothetical protein